MMYEHLQKWGPRKQEVKFFLRHEDSPTESSDQGAYCHALLCLEVCVVSAWRVESRVVREFQTPALHGCSAVDAGVSSCFSLLFSHWYLKSFGFSCVCFLVFAAPSSSCTVNLSLLIHVTHQRCCWWTHVSSSLVSTFLGEVEIRL